MQDLSPEQLKKLERLAKVLDNGDVELLSQIDQLETELTTKIVEVESVATNALNVAIQKQVQGERGIQGERGEKGETGEKGRDGKDGIDGKDGKDGADGKDGKDGFIDETTIGYIENKIEELDKKIVEVGARKGGGGGIHKGAVMDLVQNTWINLAANAKYTGTTTTISSGEVLTYLLNGVTIYRFINSTEDLYGYSIEDSFYSGFSGGVLSGLIGTRG